MKVLGSNIYTNHSKYIVQLHLHVSSLCVYKWDVLTQFCPKAKPTTWSHRQETVNTSSNSNYTNNKCTIHVHVHLCMQLCWHIPHLKVKVKHYLLHSICCDPYGVLSSHWQTVSHSECIPRYRIIEVCVCVCISVCVWATKQTGKSLSL